MKLIDKFKKVRANLDEFTELCCFRIDSYIIAYIDPIDGTLISAKDIPEKALGDYILWLNTLVRDTQND